ncbi:MAG: hypothetical protein JXM79_11785, partial [Sedimentisphaerales bacterium]|nr:hypothetical protein [Sedimentisphaerales bacterium]
MLLKSRQTSAWIFVLIGFLISNCNSIGGTDISGMQQTSEQISVLKTLRNERERAKFRRRRIIMNNDGNDFIIQSKADLEPPDAFLDRRTTALVDSQVDSIFYCTGVFDKYYNLMDESDRVPDRMIKSELVKLMKQRQIDCLKIMTDFCHEHGKEIFWSMRMNDTHDSDPQRSDLMSQWKKDHPEFLVGSLDDRYNLPYGNGRWSSVNYGLQEVRDKVYRILSEICRRYDVDGIELDFLRHPILFKEHVWGQPVSREHRDVLTGLIRRIRQMTEREGLRRNRPFLVAIRVPDSTGFCRAIGIDLEQWLEEGLIDIVTGGGSRRYEPWENLVKLGKTYHVPVYACFEEGRLRRITETKNEINLPVWRGEALNAWRAGVNGVYTFNLFDPTNRLFREIGDPKLLEGLERVDQSVFINESLHAPPEEWIKGGRCYVRNDEALRKIRQAREQAKRRKRRIIMNNDGNDSRGRSGLEPSAENFLNIRTSALAGSQVDSIFYCDGVFNCYCRQNTFKYFSRRPRTFDECRTRNGKPLWGWTLIEKTGKAPLDLVVEFGDKHDIEVFWSMRMNDTHDSSVKNRDLLCNWKKNNMHCLMGRVDETFPYSSRWSAVNYDLEEVRDKVYHLIKGVCVNHDIDGI